MEKPRFMRFLTLKSRKKQKNQKNLKKGVDLWGCIWYYSQAPYERRTARAKRKLSEAGQDLEN
ncbi:hypothetical protein [Caproiciproducens sp. LBM24188]|nr:hypothetical protein [Oscillospiraceae bacterium]